MKKKKGGYPQYLKENIDGKAFLLEAGQGKHADGNVFAILRCLERDAQWRSYKPYLVTVKESEEDIKAKLSFYGFTRTKTVIRGSDSYKRLLATAKYLVTDNSFPTYFVKRKEQVYLNTWHGTPLKCLGRRDIDNATSIGNVQKNFLSADYLLYPNSYTRDIMMRDYMIDSLFGGKTVLCDYPRNDALFVTGAKRSEIRDKFGMKGRVLAYMPTWRGTGRNADIQSQVEDAKKVVRQIESCLGEDEILYVNFHFLIGDHLDYSEFTKARPFPEDYETYEFLCACDTLISDYSSVIIDFAQTGRDIIMYMYDYDEYMAQKGFYFDITKLPFKKAYDEEQLKFLIQSPAEGYRLEEEFRSTNCGCASEKILQLLCEGKEEGLEVQSWNQDNDMTILYAGDLEKEISGRLTDKVLDGLSDEEKKNTVIAFENDLGPQTIRYLKGLDPAVGFLRMAGKGNMSREEKAALHFNRSRGWFASRAQEYYKREYKRLFETINCREISFLNTDMFYRIGTITAGDKPTSIHKIPLAFYEKPNDILYRHPQVIDALYSSFGRIIEHNDITPDLWGDVPCTGIFAEIESFDIDRTEEHTILHGQMQITLPEDLMPLPCELEIGSKVYSDVFVYPLQWTRKDTAVTDGVRRVTGSFAVSVPTGEMTAWYSSNLVSIRMNAGEALLRVPVMSKKGRRGDVQVVSVPGSDMVCELKEDYRLIRFMIRQRNISDNKAEQNKLKRAYALSKIRTGKRPVLLYEKNCARYEESASVLFEKLIDQGRTDVRFILDRDYAHRDQIDAKYRKYIVDRYSMEHYINMFAARSIISSESLDHCLEKKSANKLFKKHILNGKKDYAFLQHGVMYMVSLDSEQRAFFRKAENGRKERVVVSSQLEADHFIENTNYTAEDIYICGLPKFDRSMQKPDADRIVVMTTWRPWEYVSGKEGLSQTGYYKMLRMIVESVPEELKDKLAVLPHPLIQDQVSRLPEDPVWKYYVPGVKYDEILSETRLMITDYSSIVYDAFYRGASIVFCWQDKDACMKQYGESAHLMLTEDLAFGDICMNREELTASIEGSYAEPPSQRYKENYAKIVTYHDGKNTERFIAMAKRDGIL